MEEVERGEERSDEGWEAASPDQPETVLIRNSTETSTH